jgi:hypothetical protein
MKRATTTPKGEVTENPAGPSAAGASAADDFEAGLAIFWQRHHRTVIVAIAAACVAILGYVVLLYMLDRREQAVQQEYGSSNTPGELIAFAKRNASHSLAGFAYLQVAVDHYRNGDFEAASTNYHESIDRLGDSILAERARLGYGVASIRGGEESKGVDVLTDLTLDDSILDGTRAEAAYNLAVIHWKNRNVDDVSRQFELIASLKNPGYWATKAESLRSGIPELNRPEG